MSKSKSGNDDAGGKDGKSDLKSESKTDAKAPADGGQAAITEGSSASKPEKASEKTVDAPEKKSKTKRPRRWRRRIKIAVLTIVVLFCIFRLAISLALPAALNKVAGYYNLDCTYDRASLSFFGGNVAIWHLRFFPRNHVKTGDQPILTTEYIQGTIDPVKLLLGKLYVWRAEVDGADISIERTRDGRIPVLEAILAARSKSIPAAKSQSPQPIDLEPPLKLEALRVEHLTAHVRDLSVTPAIDTKVRLGVRISDVGSAARPMRFEVNVAMDGLLDSLEISGERTGGTSNLDADLSVLIQGLKLKPAAGYLRPLGIVPVANNLTVRMHGHLKAAASTQPTTAPWVSASLALRDFSVEADGKEAIGCDEIKLPIPYADAKSAKLGQITIEGVRINGERLANGTLRFAGLDLVKSPEASAKAPASAPAGTATNGAFAAAQSATQPAAAPYRVTADGFRLLDAKFSFEDHAVSPAGKFALLIDEISSKKLSLDPRDANSTLNLSGIFHLPGLVRDVRLDGELRPFAADKTARVSLRASGIRPELLKPYLDAIGIESLYNDGNFQCDATCDEQTGKAGRPTISARLFDVKLSDTQQLLALDQVKLAGLSFSPQNLIRIDSLEIDGPSLSATRDATGAWSSIGFRAKEPAAKTTVSTSPPAPAAAANAPVMPAAVAAAQSPVAPPSDLPRVEIGKFSWKNVRLDLEDQTMHPAKHLVLNDAGIEMTDFRFDLNADHPAQPGHVKLWLSAEDIARRLTLDGTITPQPGAMSVDLNLDGEGLSGSLIAPYLSSMGIVPTLRDGKITAAIRGKITKTADGGITSSLAVEKLHYTDGASDLASIDSLRVDDANIDGGNLSIGAIEMEQPMFRAARDADGSLEIGGLRLRAAPPAAEQPVAAADPSAGPASRAAGDPAQPAAQPPARPAAAGSAPVALLKKLRIHNAQIIWSDHAVARSVETSVSATIKLDNFLLGRRGEPSHLDVLLHIPGSLDEMHISGDMLTAPHEQTATLAINAHGIKAGALASYLPPGMRLNVADGRLQMEVDASVSANPAGGQAAKLIIDKFVWQDGTQSPLAAFDRFTLDAPRIDLPGKRIALEELSLAGLQTELKMLPGGVIELLGLNISTPPAATPAAKPVPPAAAPAAPVAPAGGAGAAGAAAPMTAQQLVAAAHQVFPLFTLEKLDLQVRHIAILDARTPGAAPLAIDNLELRNPQPIKWLGPDAVNLPPTKFLLTGRIDPLIDNLSVTTTIAPFARQPSLEIDLAASGIHGGGITKLMPELSSRIDGQTMNDGRFRTHLKATLSVQRRGGSVAFDLAKGFDLNLLLSGTEFRATPDGPVMLGLDELRTDDVRFRPLQKSLRIKSIELTKPIGSALIDHDGLHVVGLVLKVPGLAATPTTNPSATQPVAAASASTSRPVIAAAAPIATQPTASVAAPATEPLGVKPEQEISIDRLLISGLNLRLEDRTASPILVVPLTGLDVEVRGLSNWLPYEDKALRFTVLVNSGKVTLPKNPANAGIPGAIGGLASMIGGKKSEAKPEFEQRDLFSEITATGNVRLYPKLTGYVKASADGLELMAFAGEAKERGGVTIGHGTFDASTDVRFPGDGSTKIHATLVATDLSLSEPPDGPLQRIFKLPAPIDLAIKALETPDGAITIPVNVTSKNGQLSGIGSTVVGAVGSVMIKAIASAPLKLAQGAAGLVGINLNFGKHKPPPPATIFFPAGSAGLEPADAARIARVIDAMRNDRHLLVIIRHDLGGGDIPVLAVRANPTPQEASALAYHLHAREQDLLHLRADLAGQTRALLAGGVDLNAAASIERLRDVDRELSETENSLDRVYDLLRPGANRQADRRTRGAGIEIGRQRLLTIQQALQAAGISNFDQRIRLVAAQYNPTQDANGGKVTITFAMSK